MPTYENADLRKLSPGVKCSARKKDGTPCGRYAIRGATVCPKHGGSAPQVVAAAKRRLAAMADAAAGRLGHFAFDDDVPPPVGLAATNSILDRAGLGAKQAVGVEVTVAPWEELLGDVAHITRAQHEAMKRGEYVPAPAESPALPPANDDIVDAEVVDPPVAHPERARDRAGAPTVPDWAEPPPATPSSRELVTLEAAAAEVAAANRAAVARARRRR